MGAPRARTRLTYSAEENVVWPARPRRPFRWGLRRRGLVLAPSRAPKAPDGSPAFCFGQLTRARRPRLVPAGSPFPEPLNLSQHRRLGLWVHLRKGGILNVQLCNFTATRTTTSARLHRLVLPRARPAGRYALLELLLAYNFIDLFYWPFRYHGSPASTSTTTGCRPTRDSVPGRTHRGTARARFATARAGAGGGRRGSPSVALQPEEYLEGPGWPLPALRRNGGLLGGARRCLRLAAAQPGALHLRRRRHPPGRVTLRARRAAANARRARAKERQAAGLSTLAEAPPPEG